jgi:hypothetical protein
MLTALTSYLAKIGSINELESDEDPAYLSAEVHGIMPQKRTNRITIEENNHHLIGIVNRYAKNPGHQNNDRDITNESVRRIRKDYNSSRHSSINKALDSFCKIDEVG